MADRLIQLGGPLYTTPPVQSKNPSVSVPKGASPFKSLLDTALQKEAAPALKFSAHATHRLQQRNIQLSETDLQRLSEATERAAQKGSKDSLLLMDNLGVIVNIPNRTVITAVDTQEMKENVFTNIDSAVLV